MMSSRSKVLSVFKSLHRTRESVFSGDNHALKFMREKINEEFRKHKTVANPEEVANLIKVATESIDVLKKEVIQLKEVRPNVYQMRKEHMQEKCMGNVKVSCGKPICTCVM